MSVTQRTTSKDQARASGARLDPWERAGYWSYIAIVPLAGASLAACARAVGAGVSPSPTRRARWCSSLIWRWSSGVWCFSGKRCAPAQQRRL